MLAWARARVRAAGRADRVRLFQARIARDPLPSPLYDAVLSNSLLHHMADPSALWAVVRACARPGAPVLVMDLMRPADARAWEVLVERYAGAVPEVLRRDFRNSLAAAFTREEVEAQLAVAGLARLAVQAVSDRHLAVSGLA
jgi:SAM-dependent methyltransferase